MDKLSLFAGLIASDGHLDKKHNAIRFVTSNRDFLYKDVLNLINNYNYKIWKSKSGFGHQKYILYVNDNRLKSSLEVKYNIPRGKKSEIIDLPKNISFEEMKNFIKGFFSGDGSISFDVKNGKSYPQIMLWSKSKRLVNSLIEFFERLDIKCKLYYSASINQYRLTIRDRKSIILFIQKIGFIHPDKQERLKRIKYEPL